MLPAEPSPKANPVPRDAATALQRALDAVAAVGLPQNSTSQWSIPLADAVDLVAALESCHGRNAPIRILEVGTFVGVGSLLMLQCFPNASLHSVDPNLPLQTEFEAMRCRHMDGDLRLRTQQYAAMAAERLGVRDRLHLHAGGFATPATFAGGRDAIPVIGPSVVAEHGPFDAIFIDGLHHEQAVLADLRLALDARRPGNGIILLHDLVGSWGSNVRRAVYRILEDRDELALVHPRYSELYRSIGRLAAESAVVPSRGDRMAALVGESIDALSNAVADAIESAIGDAAAQPADAASERIAAILGHRSTGGTPVVVAINSLDDLPPAEARSRLSAWAASADVMVLGLTPPGEQGVAGPWSRPLARRVRDLAAVGFDAFDRIIPFLEPFTYSMGSATMVDLPGTLLSTSVIAIRRDSKTHRRILADGARPLNEDSARCLDDLRTQLAHHRAFIRRERHDREQTAGLLADAQRALAESTGWRIRIGRHGFLRTNA